MTPRAANQTMADVKVRNLPEWVVAFFRNQAQHEGRSLEEELRMLLTGEAMERRQETVRKLTEFQTKMRRKYGDLSDSTPGIREERQASG